MYLISTFPASKINIDNYPAIKEYLQSFGKRLEQSGEKGSRKKTNNKWFETQDSIAYFNDFEKEKIVYPCIMNKESYFNYDDNRYTVLAPGNIIIGEHIKFILAFLNSRLIYYAFLNLYMGGGIGRELKSNNLEKTPIPKIDIKEQEPFIKLVDNILEAKQKIKDYKTLLDEAITNNNFDREIALKKELEKLENICKTSEETINNLVYKLYNLTTDEIKIIGNI